MSAAIRSWGLAAQLMAGATGWSVAAAQDERSLEIVRQAAEALGGLDRISAVENITLIGYGQWAYQFGGGNITASPHAPQKWQAANDLRRVYDLENGRFQQLERRNFLFPFAAEFGHNFAPVNLILDGDIAYDIGFDGQSRRVAEWTENPLYVDGVHMRRMWMLNNPVAAVRAALGSDTLLGRPRYENELAIIDVTLAAGDELSLAFDRMTHLPAWIRWANPQTDLGQITFTTHFTGYAPFDDILLPLGYNTNLDWRDIDYFKLYVDNYLINGEIENLAAPRSVINTAPPQPFGGGPIESVEVEDGIWRIDTGTIVLEFEDHLTLFELGSQEARAHEVLDYARNLVPGKPITELIVSHAHFDHAAGLRAAVSEGITIVSRRGNESIFREMAEHPAPDYPDALERSGQSLRFIPVDEHLRLSDDTMTVDVYWARANTHMADAVFAYVPDAKVIIEGDIATAAYDWQFWADNYMDNIEHYGLDVETAAPVHFPVMTQAEVIEFVRGGVQRARELCARELAKGNYFAGCPIQSDRY
jgi:glyoxylase-like metal-dependent hydrolase (beta-lactamase superfamily II)